jgi:hypothetical protein
MLDQFGITPVHEALCKPIDQSQRPGRSTNQQTARVRRHPTAVEGRFNPTAFHSFKSEQVRDTLCWHRGVPLGVPKIVAAQQLSQSPGPDAPNLCEISGLGGRARQRRQHLRERLVGDRLDLGRGAVLDRMLDEDDGGLEAQRIALRGDALGELGRDDVDTGEAAAIEIVEVVQTARCAGPSIR